MGKTRALQGVLLLFLVCVASPGWAHPAPFSFIELHIEAAEPHGSLTIHDYDVIHALDLDASADLRDRARLRELRNQLIALIDDRLHLTIDGHRVTPQWGVIEPLPESQSLLLTFGLERTMQAKIALEAQLFPYDAAHQTFVSVYVDHRLQQQAVLSVDQPSMLFFAGGVQGRAALVSTFLQSGIRHIAIGFDHVSFLVGLIVLGGSLRRLTIIVTAFTISHSITLTLATLGLVQLPQAPVEAMIALSIIVVGVDNMLVLHARSKGRVSRDIRAPLAGTFGLLHGFGFASVLAETNLPSGALAWSLGAFNVGVEIGQLFIVIVLVAASRRLMNIGGMRAATMHRAALVCSIAITAFGAYWLLQRIGWI